MLDLNNKDIIEKYKFDDKPYLKGDFPHLFNTPENQNYIGPIPDKKFYGIDQMKNVNMIKIINYVIQNAKDVVLLNGIMIKVVY